MLNRAFSRCFKTSFNLSKLNLYGSFYSFNIKNLSSKKDKGRLSDSETKRGAKAFTSDNSETVSYESKSGNVKQIQTVSGHTVYLIIILASY